MSFPGLMAKAPKMDPAVAESQKAQARAEQERVKELKKKQLEATKGQLAGTGVRSLISSAGTGGFGRNFFG